MSRSRIAAPILLIGVLIAGCTSTTGGTTPPTGPASQLAAGGACERSARPAKCLEFSRTQPKTGDELFASWKANEAVSSQMLCSTLPDQTVEKFLGAGFYRYVNDNSTCEMWSADDQVAIKLGLYGDAPLKDYLTRFMSDPQAATNTQQIQIAGVPAMRTGLKTDSDGVGAEREDLTLAPTGDSARSGVLQIQLQLLPPRGKASNTPADRSRLAFRDQLAADLLTALFPKR